MVFNVEEVEKGKYKRTVLKPKNYAQSAMIIEECINYVRCMMAGISPRWKDYKGEKRIRVRDSTLAGLRNKKTGKKLHPNMPTTMWFKKLISQLKLALKNSRELCKRKRDVTATTVKLPDVKGNGEYFDANISKFMMLKDRGFEADISSTVLLNSFFNIYFRLFNCKNTKMPNEYLDGDEDAVIVRDQKASLRKAFRKADNIKIDDNLYYLLVPFSGNALIYRNINGSSESFDVKDTKFIPRIILTSKYMTMFKVRHPDTNKPIKVPSNDSIKEKLRLERLLFASLKEHLDAKDARLAAGDKKGAKDIDATIKNICAEYKFPHPDTFAFTAADVVEDPDGETRLL
jgi:hypothetical protein